MEHIVFRNSDLFCTHCGASEKVKMSVSIPEMVKQADTFNMKHANCGKTWEEPQADMSLSIEKRIVWWLQNGERGRSSETMLCVCFNYDLVGFSFGCPQDTDDFNRCYKLVTAIP